MNERKFILKSKTFWFNFLSIIGVAIGVLPINLYTAVGGAIINLVLRTLTDTGITVVASSNLNEKRRIN